MPGGTFVTTGHTSGSADAGTTACAVADGAPRLPALMVVNAPPRNVRRFIMSGLPSRQGPQKFNNMAGASASRPLRVIASKAIERVDLSERAAPTEKPRSYCPVSKLHCAPPPAFCMTSFGSIVHRSLETLSMLEPAAPSEGMPAAAIVAPTSL